MTVFHEEDKAPSVSYENYRTEHQEKWNKFRKENERPKEKSEKVELKLMLACEHFMLDRTVAML